MLSNETGHAFRRPTLGPSPLRSAYVARERALALGLDLHEPSRRARLGHAPGPVRGRLTRLRKRRPTNITLAVLTRPDDPRTAPLVSRLAPLFGETVVICDSERMDDPPWNGPNVRTIAHPLADDFGAQRNAAQEAATCDWVLHLDTDEDLQGFDHLSALTALAEREGLDAIGFPRLNLVDGRASDLWPDVQYRLLHRTVRFEGRVHERPDACRDWRRTAVARCCTIRHHLDRARVAARSRRYDALGQHGDRHGDDAALLRPYRP